MKIVLHFCMMCFSHSAFDTPRTLLANMPCAMLPFWAYMIQSIGVLVDEDLTTLSCRESDVRRLARQNFVEVVQSKQDLQAKADELHEGAVNLLETRR